MSTKCILIIPYYLQSENSLWDSNSIEYFAHITNYIHLYKNCDRIYLCDDFNARMGNKQDCKTDIDDVCQRYVLDKASNKQGDVLHDYFVIL